MAQIGEFSFVLAAAGLSAGAIDLGSYQLALSVIALSLILSPIWLTTVRRFHDLGQQQFEGFAATLESLYPGTYARLRAGAEQVNRRLRRNGQEVQDEAEPEAPREAGEDRKDP
jgi:CPA2 family monovalent cation:H+ antiporter-2